MEEIGYWLKEQSSGLWMRQLQTDRTHSLAHDFHRTAWSNPGERALHLKVAWKDYNKSVSRLQSVYKSNNSNDLIKLRIVPEMNQLTNTTTRGKAERLRLRQAAFTMKIEGQTSREVSNLDYFDAAFGHSLRSLIMTIKSTAHPAIPLFHSVDPRWDENGWVFSFLPQLTAKANTCVAGLLPYLRYLVGPELHSTVEKSFTAEVAERSAQSFWDADAGKVVSPTDALVDHTLDADPDYDFTALALLNPDGTTQAAVSAVPVRPGASGTPVRLPALGEDSVSTLWHTR